MHSIQFQFENLDFLTEVINMFTHSYSVVCMHVEGFESTQQLASYSYLNVYEVTV